MRIKRITIVLLLGITLIAGFACDTTEWATDARHRVSIETSIVKVGNKSVAINTTEQDLPGSLLAINGQHFNLDTGASIKFHVWARVTSIGSSSCASGYPALGWVDIAGTYIHTLGFHGDSGIGCFKYTHNGTSTSFFPNHNDDNTGNPGYIDDDVGVYHVNAWYEFDITFDLANSKQYTLVRGDGETNWRDLGDIDLKTTTGVTITDLYTICAFATKASSHSTPNLYYADDFQAYAYPGGVLIFDSGFE